MNDINIFKNAMLQAEKTLEYTLLLPEITPVKTKTDTVIDKALFQTYQNCHCRLMEKFGYSFFGSFNATNSIGNLFQIVAMDCDDISSIYQHDFFASTLLSQCLMASYDTIIQLLTENEYITAYTLNKKVQALGFNELLDNQIITIPFNTNRSKNEKYREASSEATGLSSKIKSHIKKLEQEGFSTSQLIDGQNSIKFYTAPLLYKFAHVPFKNFSDLLSLYNKTSFFTSKDIQDSRETIKTFCENTDYNRVFNEGLRQSSAASQVDALYYYYKLERMFNINLANCAVQNIEKLKSTDNLYPSGNNDLQNLSSICRFPNVFSRNLYLQYAFESIRDKSDIYNSKFDRLSYPTAAMYYIETHPYDIHKWNLTFKKFCLLFTNFLFPAEEWYFFITIMKTLYLDSDPFVQPNSFRQLHTLLKNYISQNFPRILFPTKELLETNKSYKIESFLEIDKYDITSELSPATLFRYFKNEDLVDEMPILPFSKNTLLKHTTANLHFEKIIKTYIDSVTTELDASEIKS